MVKLNVWKRMFPARTHEGAVAQKVDPKPELRRSVLTCLLWEDTFYEKGTGIAERIATLVAKNKPEDVAALARKTEGRRAGGRLEETRREHARVSRHLGGRFVRREGPAREL